MKPTPIATTISEGVVAYCEAIDAPDFDESVIASPQRAYGDRVARSRTRPRIAAYVAAAIVLFVLLYNIPTVVAQVQRVFAAFTVASAGRTMPMTIQEVSIDQARADMPFAVIVPPPIVGAQIVAIDEVHAPNAPSDASVIFEIHGSAAGPEIMIIESDAAESHSPTLFTLRGRADATEPKPLNPLEPRAQVADPKPRVMLREAFNGRAFAPTSWVARGTRVVVMSPPGFLSVKQLGAIQRAMSR